MKIGIKILGLACIFLMLSGCNEELKARIDALDAENSALKVDYNAAQAALTGCLARESATQASAASASTPAAAVTVPAEKMPLSVAWRNGLLSGKVLILKAQGQPFAVTVRHRQSGQFKEKRFIVDSEKALEIGGAEGFPFSPGDDLIFEAEGFKPFYLSAPM